MGDKANLAGVTATGYDTTDDWHGTKSAPPPIPAK